MKTIGGTMVCHNCFEFDYCVDAAVDSLIPVCQEIVIVDAESTDGTSDYLREKALKHSTIRVVKEKWVPNAMGVWLSDLGNIARSLLSTAYHFHLQADEVLHEESYGTMRQFTECGKAGVCKRLNFWMDHKHLVPDSAQKVSTNVIRLAPTECHLVGDSESISPHGYHVATLDIQIYHYGFIRDIAAFSRKSKPMQTAFFGSYDKIFDTVDVEGASALTDERFKTAVPKSLLVPFNGNHPMFANRWLLAHGMI